MLWFAALDTATYSLTLYIDWNKHIGYLFWENEEHVCLLILTMECLKLGGGERKIGFKVYSCVGSRVVSS